MSSDPLALGDDALIAAQRLAMWSARAPELEEDVALTNIALDQLGAARLFLSLVGDEDELAYLRTDREFRNVLLVELPERDFAVLVAKLLFLSAFQVLNYERLRDGTDQRLGEIAAKTVKESAYHLDHATQWTLRLGDGTELSHQRMQAAVDDVWPYTLFEDVPALREPWLSTVDSVLTGATVRRPADAWVPTGGRQGRHTEALSYLLAEMQVLHRAHPGARW